MDYVAAIKSGDKLVFEEVYYRFHERFYFFVLKKTASEDIAEEVVQISFIKIWEKRANLSGDFSIEVQLARTVRSVMVDTLRKKATERSALKQIGLHIEQVKLDDPLVSKQLTEKLHAAIDGLPPECKKIFILSREQGLSYNEIAHHLSISPKTVENQVSKALKAMRKAAALAFILNL